MKITIIVALCFSLMVAACGPLPSEGDSSAAQPLKGELAGCNMYQIFALGSYHHVMRCANSTSTQYHSGKTTKEVSVVESDSQPTQSKEEYLTKVHEAQERFNKELEELKRSNK